MSNVTGPFTVTHQIRVFALQISFLLVWAVKLGMLIYCPARRRIVQMPSHILTAVFRCQG